MIFTFVNGRSVPSPLLNAVNSFAFAYYSPSGGSFYASPNGSEYYTQPPV